MFDILYLKNAIIFEIKNLRKTSTIFFYFILLAQGSFIFLLLNSLSFYVYVDVFYRHQFALFIVSISDYILIVCKACVNIQLIPILFKHICRIDVIVSIHNKYSTTDKILIYEIKQFFILLELRITLFSSFHFTSIYTLKN